MQARIARAKTVTNENDENGGTARMTRAKAASLVVDDSAGAPPMKKALQSKKLATNAAPTQKRAALGDVSNVTKADPTEGKDAKKAGTAKRGLVSKVSQTAGVSKSSRPAAARPVLGSKDSNTAKKAALPELKRSASGSGVMGGVQKKRNTSSSSQPSIREQAEDELVSQPPKKQAAIVENEKKSSIETNALSKPVEVKETTHLATLDPEDDATALAAAVTASEVHDLDAEDIEDPLMVAEYVVEIFEYLKSLEETTLPNHEYMDHQEDLEWKMRGILVDWLIEVHARFRLAAETLFLAVNIIDRFLSMKVVQLDRLQLVGVTALFIASKYEDVINPDVAHLRHVADDGFSEEEILSAERYVLGALNYDLSYPNPMNFLRRISKADDYDIQTRTIGKYLMEISLLDHRFMQYTPSHIAAAAMYLSRMILERGEWVSASTFSLERC